MQTETRYDVTGVGRDQQKVWLTTSTVVNAHRIASTVMEPTITQVVTVITKKVVVEEDEPTNNTAAAEKLAQRFHERYEELAPEYSYKTREASAVPWEDVPNNNKQLMIAVCAPIADEIELLRSQREDGYSEIARLQEQQQKEDN